MLIFKKHYHWIHKEYGHRRDLKNGKYYYRNDHRLGQPRLEVFVTVSKIHYESQTHLEKVEEDRNYNEVARSVQRNENNLESFLVANMSCHVIIKDCQYVYKRVARYVYNLDNYECSRGHLL